MVKTSKAKKSADKSTEINLGHWGQDYPIDNGGPYWDDRFRAFADPLYTGRFWNHPQAGWIEIKPEIFLQH